MLSTPFLDIFVGIVITSNAGSNAVTVIRESYGTSASPDAGWFIQGVVLSHVIGNFWGFKLSDLPQPGTRVLCMLDTSYSCYVFGSIPANSVGVDALPSRASLGAGDALKDDANRQGHTDNVTMLMDSRRPTDAVDGEYVVSNEFGVLVGLYQQLANLKASELAQIQCFLLDDLVRIISHNFQHYTALGEYNIYHDGKRLMAEFGATHKPSETYGGPAVDSDTPKEPAFSKTGEHTVDDSDDFYKIEKDERVKAIERFKLFLGSVGDFVHLFVTRPDPDESRILDPEKDIETPDTGLADVHIGTDGGVHVRSVKEVFIEKTNWIRVPHRKAAPDDPLGDDAEKLEYDEKEKFEFTDEYKYKGNPFSYALQIRDYVAYVNEKLGYQNFKKHEKDFHVNDVIDNENSLKEIKKIDAETSLHLQDYKLRTAGVYLMPNGGVTIRDAWNSAIVMEGGNIYLQPAKDLVSQPLRNNIVKAGAHINMSCKKHIDMSSTEEGVRIKSEKAMCLYSHDSGILIQANGETEATGVVEDSRAIEQVGGIVLKSKLHVYNYAEKDIVSYAKGKILFQSIQNIDLIADTSMTMYSKGQSFFMAEKMIAMHSSNSTLITSDDSVVLAGISSTSLGQKDQYLGIQYDDDSPFVDVLKGCVPVSDITKSYEEIKKAKKEILEQTIYQDTDTLDDVKFKFPSSDQYGALIPREDALPTTLAQQDDLLTQLYNLDTWEEKEVNDTLPYPGKDLFENFYISSSKPVNLEENNLGKDYSNKAEAGKKPAEIKLDSLKKYKIQK